MTHSFSWMADRLWMYRLSDREHQPLDSDMPAGILRKFQPWCLENNVFCVSRGPWLVVFDPLQRMTDRIRIDNKLIPQLGAELDVISLDANDLASDEPDRGLPPLDARALAITIEVIALSQQVLAEVFMGCTEMSQLAQRMALNQGYRTP